ncbi:uncharacterized protein LOC143911969 [Arctopsyche grandis]|uniref:uncharacterized protein LOC143911969 n=1 Tax=Arctopsyche grandis TaxID=121162 RepID=UPI00406D8728
MFLGFYWSWAGAVSGLQLGMVTIPAFALKDTFVRLQCKYRLEPGESLYSVKWYKDGSEFFRYVPKDEPPAQIFETPGVDIDIENCTETSVAFGPLTYISSGKYRCEISGEAPIFQTVSHYRDLTVVTMPNDGPKVVGGRSRYHINDLVKLNCSFGRSKPPAVLSWFVNGEPANETFLRGPYRDVDGIDDLCTTYLGLEFRVQPKHFKSGDMKLKCIATVASKYSKIREERVEGMSPQRTPALESRDSAIAGDSRADRVQAGSNVASQNQLLLTVSLILCLCNALKYNIR